MQTGRFNVSPRVAFLCGFCLVVAWDASQSAAQILAASRYTTDNLQIKGVKWAADGKLTIAFQTRAETLYYWPSVHGRQTKQGLELHFVRSQIKRKLKLQFPAPKVPKSTLQYIAVDVGNRALFWKSGKRLAKIVVPPRKK